MRRRSVDMKTTDKPKPQTRRRKKFQTPGNLAEEEGEGPPIEPSNQNQSLDISEETWEVISPGLKIREEDFKKTSVKHLRSDKISATGVKGQHPEPTVEVKSQAEEPAIEVKNQPEAPPTPNGEVLSNETFEQAVRALSFKKKKPPPMRPTPYTEKTPPVPPKKKKVVPALEEPDLGPQPLVEEERGEHIYEVVDRSDLRCVCRVCV